VLADLTLRAALAGLLIVLGLALFLGWRRVQLGRLRRVPLGRQPGLESWQPGVPAILYFTTPDCGVCRAAQRPALERLRAHLGSQLQVLEVDAAARPAVADHWGVLSVPTTFVLDPAGQPRLVNHGLAGQAKLAKQLKDVCRAGEPGTVAQPAPLRQAPVPVESDHRR
jgi:hypothetical protein